MSGDSENYECKKCGESFDNKRGLHVHQSRVHGESGDEEVPDLFEVKSAKPWILAAAVIMLGLLFLRYSADLAQEHVNTGKEIDRGGNKKSYQTKTITVWVVRNSTGNKKVSPPS